MIHFTSNGVKKLTESVIKRDRRSHTYGSVDGRVHRYPHRAVAGGIVIALQAPLAGNMWSDTVVPFVKRAPGEARSFEERGRRFSVSIVGARLREACRDGWVWGEMYIVMLISPNWNHSVNVL